MVGSYAMSASVLQLTESELPASDGPAPPPAPLAAPQTAPPPAPSSVPPPAPPFQIFVRFQHTFAVDGLHMLDTIQQLEEKVEKKCSIPRGKVRMLYGSKQLDHMRTLQDYQLFQGATIHLVGRLQGGGAGKSKSQIAPDPTPSSWYPVAHDDDVPKEDSSPVTMVGGSEDLEGARAVPVLTPAERVAAAEKALAEAKAAAAAAAHAEKTDMLFTGREAASATSRVENLEMESGAEGKEMTGYAAKDTTEIATDRVAVEEDAALEGQGAVAEDEQPQREIRYDSVAADLTSSSGTGESGEKPIHEKMPEETIDMKEPLDPTTMNTGLARETAHGSEQAVSKFKQEVQAVLDKEFLDPDELKRVVENALMQDDMIDRQEIQEAVVHLAKVNDFYKCIAILEKDGVADPSERYEMLKTAIEDHVALKLPPVNTMSVIQEMLADVNRAEEELAKTMEPKGDPPTLSEHVLQKAFEKAIFARVPARSLSGAELLLQKMAEAGRRLQEALEQAPLSLAKIAFAIEQCESPYVEEHAKLLKKAKTFLIAITALTDLPGPPASSNEIGEEVAIAVTNQIKQALQQAADVGLDKEDEYVAKARALLADWSLHCPKNVPAVTMLKKKNSFAGGLVTSGKVSDADMKATSFWFVKAAQLRTVPLARLPKLQELQEWEARDGKGVWLEKKEISYEESFTGVYNGTMLAVSHCWEDPGYPDGKNAQLEALVSHLKEPENALIELVWYDYMCLTQGERTIAEEREFERMLPNVNLLYLGAAVLILMDFSYLSRFWTQLEAWLSFQRCTPYGLVACDSNHRRCTIVCLHNAAVSKDSQIESLVTTWSGKTAAEAYKVLASPDVKVTNKKDKEVQLPKVNMMNELSKQVYASLNNRSILWLELEDKALTINPEADAVLDEYRDLPLNIISVCGKLRTGKSYLMNSLLESEVFGVSPDLESYTQGVHLSSLLMPYSKMVPRRSAKPLIGFVDMEGQSDKGQRYDIKLATPLLIISKVVLLNVLSGSGPPKEEILRTLEMMIMAAKQVRSIAADGDGDEAPLAEDDALVREKIFGNLHVILRDSPPGREDQCDQIIFGLEDETGKKSADEREALKQRNTIRNEIFKTFESKPKTWCLPRLRTTPPPPNYRECQDQEYIAKIDEIRAYMAQQLAEPKLFNGMALTAGMVASMMPELQNALLADDPTINPPSMMQAVLTRNWQRIEKAIEELTIKTFGELRELIPISIKELLERVDLLRNEAMEQVENARRHLPNPKSEENAEHAANVLRIFERQSELLLEQNLQALRAVTTKTLWERMNPPVDLAKLEKAFHAAADPEINLPIEDLEPATNKLEKLFDNLEKISISMAQRPINLAFLKLQLGIANDLGQSPLDIIVPAKDRLHAVESQIRELERLSRERPVPTEELMAALEDAQEEGVPAEIIELSRALLSEIAEKKALLVSLYTERPLKLLLLRQAFREGNDLGLDDFVMGEAEKALQWSDQASHALEVAVAIPGDTLALEQAIQSAEQYGVTEDKVSDAKATLHKVLEAQKALQTVMAKKHDILELKTAIDNAVSAKVGATVIAEANTQLSVERDAMTKNLSDAKDKRPLDVESLCEVIAESKRVGISHLAIESAEEVLSKAKDLESRLVEQLVMATEIATVDLEGSILEAEKAGVPEFIVSQAKAKVKELSQKRKLLETSSELPLDIDKLKHAIEQCADLHESNLAPAKEALTRGQKLLDMLQLRSVRPIDEVGLADAIAAAESILAPALLKPAEEALRRLKEAKTKLKFALKNPGSVDDAKAAITEARESGLPEDECSKAEGQIQRTLAAHETLESALRQAPLDFNALSDALAAAKRELITGPIMDEAVEKLSQAKEAQTGLLAELGRNPLDYNVVEDLIERVQKTGGNEETIARAQGVLRDSKAAEAELLAQVDARKARGKSTGAPIGLKWTRIVSDAPPSDGVELVCPALAAALKSRTMFTEEELICFNIKDLSIKSFVRVMVETDDKLIRQLHDTDASSKTAVTPCAPRDPHEATPPSLVELVATSEIKETVESTESSAASNKPDPAAGGEVNARAQPPDDALCSMAEELLNSSSASHAETDKAKVVSCWYFVPDQGLGSIDNGIEALEVALVAAVRAAVPLKTRRTAEEMIKAHEKALGELKVELALGKGDFNALQKAINRARVAGVSESELRSPMQQAENVRKAFTILQKAFDDDGDDATLGAAIQAAQEAGLSGKLLDDAKERRATKVESDRLQAAKSVQSSMAADPIDILSLQRALQEAKEIGVPAELLATALDCIKGVADLEDRLVSLCDSFPVDVDALKNALDKARALRLNRAPGSIVANAKKMLSEVENASETLKKALTLYELQTSSHTMHSFHEALKNQRRVGIESTLLDDIEESVYDDLWDQLNPRIQATEVDIDEAKVLLPLYGDVLKLRFDTLKREIQKKGDASELKKVFSSSGLEAAINAFDIYEVDYVKALFDAIHKAKKESLDCALIANCGPTYTTRSTKHLSHGAGYGGGRADSYHDGYSHYHHYGAGRTAYGKNGSSSIDPRGVGYGGGLASYYSGYPKYDGGRSAYDKVGSRSTATSSSFYRDRYSTVPSPPYSPPASPLSSPASSSCSFLHSHEELASAVIPFPSPPPSPAGDYFYNRSSAKVGTKSSSHYSHGYDGMEGPYSRTGSHYGYNRGVRYTPYDAPGVSMPARGGVMGFVDGVTSMFGIGRKSRERTGPPMFVRSDLLEMILLFDQAKRVQQTARHKRMLFRALFTNTGSLDPALIGLREDIYESLKEQTDIDEDKFKLLEAYTSVFARALIELDDVYGSLSTVIKKPFLKLQRDNLKHFLDDMLAKVSLNQKLPRSERGHYSSTTIAWMAYSWLSFYANSMHSYRKLGEICRKEADNTRVEKLMMQLIACAEVSAAKALVKGMKEDDPVGIKHNAELYVTLTELSFICHATLLLPISPEDTIEISSAEQEFSKLFGGRDASPLRMYGGTLQKWISQEDETISPREKTVRDLIHLCWMHFGISALPSTAASTINWVTYYLLFVTDNLGQFNKYAEFVEGAHDLAEELPTAPPESYSSLFKLHSVNFPEGMRAFTSFLKAYRTASDKFLYQSTYKDLFKSVISSFESTTLAKTVEFVKLSADPLLEASDRDDEEQIASTVIHLNAVRVARDMLTTYNGLNEQPPEFGADGKPDVSRQLKEWQTVAEMIMLAKDVTCNDQPKKSCREWEPRIAALKASLVMFAHFSYTNAKSKAGGGEPNMIDVMDKLLTILRGVYTPVYSETSEFYKQLARLIVYVEFNMTMPSITPAKALDLYQEEMTNPERKFMMADAFVSEHKNNLEIAYTVYSTEFEKYEKKYLRAGEHVPLMLQEIFEVSKKECFAGAVDKHWGHTEDFHTHLPVLLARLAFLFSLLRSNMIKDGDSGPMTMVCEKGALGTVRPHCIQVLGVIGLLSGDTRGPVVNKISEVLTGQGKSWVLLLLASIFATTGKDVIILCHNEDLTVRDSREARSANDSIFLNLLAGARDMGVKGSRMGNVSYQTYMELCWKMLESSASQAGKEEDETGRLLGMEAFVSFMLSSSSAASDMNLSKVSSAQLGNDTVLLIDEVDVLFGTLYGSTLNPVSLVPNRVYGRIQAKMWKEGRKLDESELAVELKDDKDKELHSSEFFQMHLKRFGTALTSVSESSDANSKWMLAKGGAEDGCVLFKHVEHGVEKWSRKTLVGYQNAFHFLRLAKIEGIQCGDSQVGPGKYGYLNVPLGKLSYAELPANFKSIFGVTGSLGVLPKTQLHILGSKYNVKHFSYFPSFWGRRMLDWNERALKSDTLSSHFSILNNEVEAFQAAIKQIKEVARQERAVLVFLEDSDMLSRFDDHARASLGTTYKLDPLQGSREDKDMIISQKSGEPRAITLATGAYGRGEDFKYSPAVLEKGGGHAIQLFLSLNKADEIQIRGRIARKNEVGSYALILNWENVDRVLGKKAGGLLRNSASASSDPTLLYRAMDTARMAGSSRAFARQCEMAESHDEMHQKTISLLQNIRLHFESRGARVTRQNIIEQLADINVDSIASIDLCFIMDCTGSMAKWIDVAKKQLFAVVSNAKEAFNAKMRVAYVGYRDYDDSPRFDIKDFTDEDHMKDMKNFIADSRATGGGDNAEDVAGGLQRANELSWSSETRVAIMIADAPAHGSDYSGGIGDDHSAMPQNPDPCEQLKKLMFEKRAHFFFFKISSATDLMTGKFESTASSATTKFAVLDLDGDTTKFLQAVQDSIGAAIGEARM